MKAGRARWHMRTWPLLALVVVTAGCGDSPSMTTPHSTEARVIDRNWWLLFWLAVGVYILVMGMVLVAMLRRRPLPDGDQMRRLDNRFIVIGGLVLPAIILGITWLFGRMIVNGIGRRTRQSVLGPLDRAMGLGFGALKGLVLASLGFLLVALATDTVWGGSTRRPTWLTHSRTYPLLNATSTYIGEIIARRRRGESMFGPDNAADGNRSAR